MLASSKGDWGIPISLQEIFKDLDSQNVTEFWKITHMGTREIIRTFVFSWLLIRAGHAQF